MMNLLKNRMMTTLLLVLVAAGSLLIIKKVDATSARAANPGMANDSTGFDVTQFDRQKLMPDKGVYDLLSGGVTFPGYIGQESTDPGACFDVMGSIKFTSAWRYRSNDPRINPEGEENRLHGFTLPLAGDLDEDGYPEIVAIQQYDNSDLVGNFTGISIFNGQNGKNLARDLKFKRANGTEITSRFTHDGFHTSPSLMSLVDSDRDGIVELIIGFPNGGDSDYTSKLVSYNLVPTRENGVTTGYTLKYRWESERKYNYDLGDAWEKPVPTIVDLDGDGTPEVVVYNKIYNAQTGALLLTLEEGTGTSSSTRSKAHVGYDDGAYDDDDYIGFNYVYDMNFDGVYDIVAGGKVYLISKSGGNFGYIKIEMADVPDGRTGVADINGDGIPDVVLISRAELRSTSLIRVVVWNPGFYKLENGEVVSDNPNGNPHILGQNTYYHYRNGGSGSNSYVYIGDIDGREQTVTIDGVEKTYRLPEIAYMARDYDYDYTTMGIHPNVANYTTGIGLSEGGIPTENNQANSDRKGDIIGITWDATPGLPVEERLKLSFVLEHEDDSNNTGFTMFDFDNDGLMEICYRDEETLRVIKASRPYIGIENKATDNTNTILFSAPVRSYTGFEYPVIVDIDNDASAEVVVMGHNSDGMPSGGGRPAIWETRGYIVAVGNGSGDKFAPALAVWNQFMYDPFKINEDMTTPIGPAPNRLSKEYQFTKLLRDDQGYEKKVIENYNPFNGTLAQLSRNNVSEGTVDGKTYDDLFEPVVYLQDAYFVTTSDEDDKKPALVEENGKVYIKILVGNNSAAKADVSISTPIVVYKDEVSMASANYYKKISLAELGLTSPVKAGEEQLLSIEVDDPFGYYILRVGDNSASTTGWRWGANAPGVQNEETCVGTATRAYRDCNWADNVAEVSRFLLVDDAATVMQYGSVLIDVLENDILQDECGVQTITSEKITTPEGAGVLSGSFGSLEIINNKLLYTAPRAYTGNVVEFSYTLACGEAVRTGNVNVYILESCSFGFAACTGAAYDVCLNENPEGVVFDWFDEMNQPLGNTSPSISNLTGDEVFYVKPDLSAVADSPYGLVDFPKGKIAIKALSSTEPIRMKWIGAVDKDWNNPNNWMQVMTDGSEAPVTWVPQSCTDVEIPAGVERYPELISVAECRKIHIADRAMIAGIHHLTYASASVDFVPKATEEDRFVMWSSPLQDVYSGDYHFLNSNGNPDWGLVYMNFFQSANPDYAGSVETEKTFTATFGSTGTALPLGKAFNVKVISGEDRFFTFPQKATGYTDANRNVSASLSRTNAHRFITDGKIGQDGKLLLPVDGDNSFELIQVVNPFLAYLDVAKFLTANAAVIQNAYYVWDGDEKADFITVLKHDDTSELRFEVDNVNQLAFATTGGYIAPLQSFFVKKLDKTTSVTALEMNSATMTTTDIGGNGKEGYVLRSAERGSEASKALRITAKLNGSENTTALLRKTGARQEFNLLSEDAEKVFHNGVPVSVYTLTQPKKAVAINVSENFYGDVKLGLRVRGADAPVVLSFEGLSGFGQEVTLIDHALSDKEIDIARESTYVFTVNIEESKDVTELNDRFSLRFRDNTTGIENLDNRTININVVANKNGIEINANSVFDQVEVFNLSGVKIHNHVIPASNCRLSVAGGQFYLVRVTVNDKYVIKKVFVK